MGALGTGRLRPARRALGLLAAGMVAMGVTACEPLEADGRDLTVGAWDSNIFMRPGTTGVAGFNLENLGTDTAVEPVMLVSIPEGFELVDAWWPASAVCTEPTEEPVTVVVCDLTEMGPSDSQWFQVTVTGSAGASGLIQVAMASESPDRGPSPKVVSVGVSAPDASFSFTGQEAGPFHPGDTIDLTVTPGEALDLISGLELEYDPTALALTGMTSLDGPEGDCMAPESWGTWCGFEGGVSSAPIQLQFLVLDGGDDQSITVTNWDSGGLLWGATTVDIISVG